MLAILTLSFRRFRLPVTRFPHTQPERPNKFRRDISRDLVGLQDVVALSRSVNWQRFILISGVSAASVNLWAWQWELVAATGIGAAVMGAIYASYDLPWTKYLDVFYRIWRSDYQRLLMSVASGAIAVSVSFGAIALWETTENHWLVVALGCQTLMIAAILLLTTKNSWMKGTNNKQFESALHDLSHSSSVKRLATIRFLRQLLQEQSLTTEQQQLLCTFLHLAWREETETVLREALLSTLSLAQKFERGMHEPTPLEKPTSRSKPLRLKNFSPVERKSWRSPRPLESMEMSQSFREERS